MIRFIAEAVPNLLYLVNCLLLLWAFTDVIGGIMDIANNRFDPQNSPWNKISGGLYKALAFLFIGMINLDLNLQYHPLYLFTVNVVDNISGVGEMIWFGCAMLVFINFVIITMVSFSRFNIMSKFMIGLFFILLIEGVNSLYDYLIN